MMNKLSIKSSISSALMSKPMLKTYRKFTRAVRKPYGAVIVNFHRFYDKDEPFLKKGPSVHTHIDTLDEILSLLSTRYQFITLDKLVDCLTNNIPLDEESAVITIDDGYLDNLNIGLPIFIKYRIRPTLYLAVEYIGSQNIMPMDMVDYALRNKTVNQIQWNEVSTKVISLENENNLEIANTKIGNYIKSLPSDKIYKELDILYEKAGVSNSFSEKIMLSWDDVITLNQSGVDIGSHGMSHICMTKLGYEEAIEELYQSRKIIREKTGVMPNHFAFPNGTPDDFSDQLREEAIKLGYRSIASTTRGINIPNITDIRNLQRVGLTGTPKDTMLYIERLFLRKYYSNSTR